MNGTDRVAKRKSEQGIILVAATIVIVAMLIMAMPFLYKLSGQSRSTERAYRSLSAFELAEAGIDRTLWEMNQMYLVTGGLVFLDENGNGAISATDEAVGEWTGSFQGTITTNLGIEPNIRTILVTGSMPHLAGHPVIRTVGVNLEKYYKSIWDMGIFGDEGIWGKTNITFDSFDSSKGAYGAKLAGGGVNRGANGDAGTNATGDSAIEIAQGSSSDVHGNLAAGAGSDPDNLKNIINLPNESILQDGGSREVLSAPFEMPAVDLWNLPEREMFKTIIDFQDWFTSEPSVDGPLLSNQIASGYNKGALKTSKTTLTAADSGVYTNFDIAKNKTLTIQGNVAIYVTGLDGATASFSGKNANINIEANSSLTLVLGKTTASVTNNVTVNNTGKAEKCLILGTDQFTGELSFRNNASLYAAIYTPRASFVIDQSNVQLYGAVVCDYIDIRNNAKIHYDEALKKLDTIKGGIPYWRMVSWQEPIGE